MSEDAHDPDFESGEQPDPIFQDRGRWLWKILLVIVLLGAGIFVGARPAYAYVKRWRALGMVEQGNRLMAEGKWDEVAKLVRTSIRLAPSEPKVVRLVAQFCTRNGAAQGISYWQTLLASPEATDEDSREYVRYVHDVGRIDLATPQLQKLLGKDKDNVTNQLLMLDHLVLMGDWAGAVRGAEIAIMQRPEDPYMKYVLAKALLGSRDPVKGSRAAEMLRDLKKPENPQYLPALRTMASLRGLPEAEVRGLIQEIESLPKPTMADRILAVEMREMLEPKKSPEIITDFVKKLPNDLEPRDISVLGGFLRSRGRHDLVLQMVPLTAGRTNAALAMMGIDALVEIKRWEPVLAMLTNAPAIDLVTRQCTLASYAFQNGRHAEGSALLRTAAGFAVSNLNQLQVVASIAERYGENNLVLDVWTAALDDPRASVGAANNLLRIGAKRDDYEAERRAYKRLNEIIGAEPAVAGEAAYLFALHDEKLDQAQELLSRQLAENPTAISPRGALALTKLQLGDRPGALGIMESGGVDWSKTEPRWQAVYAAVLDANQQRAAAREVASKIDPKRLRAPERRLIEGLGAPARRAAR